jgi:hypothetical protein
MHLEFETTEDIWLLVKGKRAKWLEKRLTPIEWRELENEALEEFHNAQ